MVAVSGKHTEAERLLAFEGVSNFRDLGGYKGVEGRPLHWRKLFRADRLSDLKDSDLALFSELKITHSVDFRGDAERQASDYQITDLKHLALPIEPQVVRDIATMLMQGEALDAATAHRLMEQTYVAFVTQNAAQYRAFFELLQQLEGPVVFHCTAGKDRTGFAAAVLLELLGVSRETIMQDYLLTNAHYRYHSPERSALAEDVAAVLWRVSPNFLNAAYQEIDSQHGSLHDYAREQLGLDAQAIESLQARYLQPS